MTASYTPLPTPPSSPEVPNPDEGGGLSPTQTSLLIVGAVIPALFCALWPHWFRIVWIRFH
ncbi:MAG: hypothetical protein ACR2PT_22975, partial [Endozoicomonas sp.]